MVNEKPISEQCSNCYYSVSFIFKGKKLIKTGLFTEKYEPSEHENFECRRNPPPYQLHGSLSDGIDIELHCEMECSVRDDHWCGEWEPRKI